MAFIELVPSEDTPNHGAAFATRPELLAAWQQLNGAIKESMDLRRYELATLAAARRCGRWTWPTRSRPTRRA